MDDGLRLHLVSLRECTLLWLNFGVFCSSSTLPMQLHPRDDWRGFVGWEFRLSVLRLDILLPPPHSASVNTHVKVVFFR